MRRAAEGGIDVPGNHEAATPRARGPGAFAPLARLTSYAAAGDPVELAAEQTGTFLGFVGATAAGVVPAPIRAVGPGGVTTCGTTDVTPSSELLGFYVLHVSAAAKEGCPVAGDPVTFRLIFGMIDENITAAQQASFRLGEWQVLHLSPGETVPTAGLSGALPERGGIALLRWQGPDGTPVEHAIASLERPVSGIWRIDAGGRWASYIPDAPGFAQTYLVVGAGDLVLVRVEAE